jgi:iduronate 2-sulfatase
MRIVLLASFLMLSFSCGVAQPNVLFIATDDLRVELGCYGQEWIHSPNLDKFADHATRFDRAYCQAALCNPSRASVMTGLYPDTIGVIDLPTHFRHVSPEVVTLPEHFKNQGYFTQNIGKVFHNWHHGDMDGDPQSWSVSAELHYNTHSKDIPTPA